MLKVLIIEDELQLLQNLASFLSSFGDVFEVLTAPSGEEGLKVLSREPLVDIVLTDLRLPGIDGIEVVRTVSNHYPGKTIAVMTAFGSSELRSKALSEGALKFIEKPVDLDELAVQLFEAHERRKGCSREVAGLEILDVAQAIALSNETKLIQFRAGFEQGTLAFDRGSMFHCSTGDVEGADAFFTISLWGEGTFWEVFDADLKSFPKNITESTMGLLEEAARLSAEMRSSGTRDGLPKHSSDRPNEKHERTARKEIELMAIKDHLSEFEGIEGFQGAAVFTAQGEMLEGIAKGKVDIKTIGMFANNALLNAQKATDQMGVGRGNLMQIRAPQAFVLMRCLNEATDFAATKDGKAHFHTVVVMDPEGNTGMASMLLDKCVARIAEEVR